MSPPKVASCIQVLIIRILNQCRHQDHHHNRHCQHHDTSDHHLLSVLLFILVDSSRRVRVSQRDARRVKTAHTLAVTATAADTHIETPKSKSQIA